MSALGKLLRHHREYAKLTQEELAERAGLSARSISDIERGVRFRAYADTADRLSVALGLTGTDRSIFLETARGRQPQQAPRSPGAVPRPLTPLLGRERELAELVRAVGTQGSRLVTVTGLGGVGKTRLALAAAAELETPFAGRVHFLEIAPNQDPRLLIPALARSLGIPERGSPVALATHLADRPTLFVLDTLDEALAAAPDIEAVVHAAPELRVLGTSRERLGIAGEQEFALLPLAVPRPGDPDWFRAPAAALFLDRIRVLRPDLDPDPEVIIDICRQVSGLPLALELAAARVRHLPLGVLRARLAAGIGDLADSRRDPPDRHRSMEQTLIWSMESLTAEEALLLRVAAMFPGGMRLDAAQRICDNAVDVVWAVSGLVDKSLMILDESSPEQAGPRWRMLDVVRQFVEERAPRASAPGLRTAFLAFFLALLDEVQKDVGREPEWFELLSAEESNLRTALTWAAEEGDADTLLRLCGGMWLFWQARGELTDGRRWLETGLALQPPADDETKMTALWGLGWLAYHQADETAAEAAATELENWLSSTTTIARTATRSRCAAWWRFLGTTQLAR